MFPLVAATSESSRCQLAEEWHLAVGGISLDDLMTSARWSSGLPADNAILEIARDTGQRLQSVSREKLEEALISARAAEGRAPEIFMRCIAMLPALRLLLVHFLCGSLMRWGAGRETKERREDPMHNANLTGLISGFHQSCDPHAKDRIWQGQSEKFISPGVTLRWYPNRESFLMKTPMP